MNDFKTRLYSNSNDGKLMVYTKKTFYTKNGERYSNGEFLYYIMPDIVDVRVMEEKGVVMVLFADGTNEKAVLNKEDKFNLEQGISICITKKLLDIKCGNGSNVYNKIIKSVKKIYTNKIDKLRKNKAEEE